MRRCVDFDAWVSRAVWELTGAWPMRLNRAPQPSDDRFYRAWRAQVIEESRERNLIEKDLQGLSAFRCVALTLAKKHCLTVTCGILERSL